MRTQSQQLKFKSLQINSFQRHFESYCENGSTASRTLFDSEMNATKTVTYSANTEDEESDDGLNDLSDLLSPLNADVIERELTELTSSANGVFNDLTVAEMVSAIDGPLLNSPLKYSPQRSRSMSAEQSPFSTLCYPSILKRRQTIVDYTTPPSMKKMRHPLNDNQMLSNATSTPFLTVTPDPKNLPFSPTQVCFFRS